jgi:hypothetical protein
MRDKEHKITVTEDMVVIETTKDTVEKLMKVLNNVKGQQFFKSTIWTLAYDLMHIPELKPSQDIQVIEPMTCDSK